MTKPSSTDQLLQAKEFTLCTVFLLQTTLDNYSSLFTENNKSTEEDLCIVMLINSSTELYMLGNICCLCPPNNRGLTTNALTNSPLSLLCCRHVEYICLVACVRLVVRLNINGELLDKGTGVSEGERTAAKSVSLKIQYMSPEGRRALEGQHIC